MKNKLLTRSIGVGALFFVSVFSAQNTEAIIRDYISSEASFKGANTNLDFKVLNENNSTSLKSNIVDIQQYYNGIPIYKALGKAVIRDGKVQNFNSNFEGKLIISTYKSSNSVNGVFQAVINNLGLKSENYKLVDDHNSKEIAGVKNVFNKLFYAFNENDKLVPAQLFFIDDLANNAFWSVLVNLENNQIIEKDNMVISCSFDHDHAEDITTGEPINFNNKSLTQLTSQTQGASKAAVLDASYSVFKLPTEAPTFGGREIVNNPWDIKVSPLGWHSTNNNDFNITRGNNVHAYYDNVGNNSPNIADNVDGGANRIFDFPYTQGAMVSAYENKKSSITNLFYMNNMMHDIFYKFGFTELSRNYQAYNFGKGGGEGDYVRAEAFDGGGYNNANFYPGYEIGNNVQGPRMQMYLWTAGAGLKQKLFYNSPADAVARPGVNAGLANFGKQVMSIPVTGDVVIPSDITGCSKETGNFAGKIVLVNHVTTCSYTTKVKNLQDAGAKGVIVYRSNNNTTVDMNDYTNGMSGVSIPSIMIGKDEGEYILGQVNNGVAVNVDLRDMGYGYKDSSFDNAIIAHEYGHGISNRMTSQGYSCLNNNEQMGEGWSDFFGLMLTNRPEFTSTTARGIGTYTSAQGTTGQGIRRLRYSTDLAINNFTYNSIQSLPIPHGVGSVWATILWDLHWKMAEKYGYNYDITADPNSGSARTMQLVVDGLSLQPCSPDFVSGRDAILRADALKGGADECLIWNVFARRGVGFGANAGSNNSTTDQTENFDVPEKCKLATNEISKDKAYSIYPNPAKGEFFIKGKPTLSADKVKVEILDTSGKLVKSFERKKNATESISTNGMPKGVYVVSITESGKVVQVDKLIVD